MAQHPGRNLPLVPSKGLYANYFQIGHTALEFIVDFGQRYEGKGATPCHTRIVMSPLYAEELLRTLSESMSQYRERFKVAK